MKRESQQQRVRNAMERVSSSVADVLMQSEYLHAATTVSDRRIRNTHLLEAARKYGNALNALSRVRK